MKRRYFYLGAAILTLIVLSIAVIVGCSAAYQESSTRMQARNNNLIGAVSGTVKNPVAADPTARRVIEGQPGEELWIIGRSEKKQPLPSDELIPGGGVLAT